MTAPDATGVPGPALASGRIGAVTAPLLRADEESRRVWRRAGWARARAIEERLKSTNIAAMRKVAVAGERVGLDLGGLRFEIVSSIERVELAVAKFFRCRPSREAEPVDAAIAVIPFNAPEANIAIVSPKRLTVACLPERGDVPYVTREWNTGKVTGGSLGPFDEADGVPAMVITKPWAWADGLVALLEMEMIHTAAQRHPDTVYLHAASLQRDGRAVLLLGDPGSGKSALSLALTAEGFRLLGNDTACIDIVSGRLHVYPRKLRIRRTSLDSLVPPLDRQDVDRLIARCNGATGQDHPDSTVAELVFLDGFAEVPELTTMSAAEARSGLIRRTLTPPSGSAVSHFVRLSRFIAGLDCHRLRAGPPAATAALVRRRLAGGRPVPQSALG